MYVDQVTAVEDDIVNLATIDEEVERELLKEQGIHEPSMVVRCSIYIKSLLFHFYFDFSYVFKCLCLSVQLHV